MKIPLYLISIERDFHTRTKKTAPPFTTQQEINENCLLVPPLWHGHIGKVARNNGGANSMEMSKNTDNNGNRVRHRLLPFLISSATDKRSKRSIGELKTPVEQKRWKISIPLHCRVPQPYGVFCIAKYRGGVTKCRKGQLNGNGRKYKGNTRKEKGSNSTITLYTPPTSLTYPDLSSRKKEVRQHLLTLQFYRKE